MLRSLAIAPLLLVVVLLLQMSFSVDARIVKMKVVTTESPLEESTYMHQVDGTITVDIDSDVILTTSPEGETFSEASPLELTEEPLPDSVIQQMERDRAQEERTQPPFNPEEEPDSETEETTTEKPKAKKSHRFGATPSMPPGLIAFPTLRPEHTSTESTEITTQYEEITSVKNYFQRRPVRLQSDGDLEMAENRMETTTDSPTFQDEKTDYPTTPFMILTTEANLVEEPATFRSESDLAESVTTQSPLFRFFTTTSAKPEVTETQPETTTMWPETKEREATTMPVLMESTVPESISEPAETTLTPVASSTAATKPDLFMARMELYLNAALETTSTASASETTTTTNAPETTTIPETTVLSISTSEATTSTTSAPETTTSTTSAPGTTTSTTSAPETTALPEPTILSETFSDTTSVPETTRSTTSVPETTRSTTSVPETTTSTTSVPELSKAPEITSSTTSAPDTTTSTTSTPLTTIPITRAPETTTTTPRPVLTREPRVERIFNSDGVEVLYGYSSVVRTNRS
ncbi:hypothetical protein KR054_005395 [Drosophila jambulina]|nr:hypothetical protein KR054_005395 [Drosophila jambulina]